MSRVLRELMCEIGRRIWTRGYCGGNEGNHSIRYGADRILCTPTGKSKGFLKPADLCVVDMKGKQISGTKKATSEILLHLAVYNNRPDIAAVVHSHPPHATAFAITHTDLPTAIHPEAEIFLGNIPSAPYVTPGDTRLGESILPYVKTASTILLHNHGVVTYAENLEKAYYQLEIVDAYARILMLAKQLGKIHVLDEQLVKEMEPLKMRFNPPGPKLF
jgi:L-fuculose-phosphate aldolase